MNLPDWYLSGALGAAALGPALVGFAWGKLSSRLPLPEFFKILIAPLWGGAFEFALASLYLFRIHTSAHHSTFRSTAGAAMLLFLGGVAFGLFPSLVGWAAGYTPQRARRHGVK